MGRGKLTKEEVEYLMGNPNVLAVNENRIVYTDSFKHFFMQEYLAGKKPTSIFREAGFDTGVLGSKRIERSACRWKESYYAGSLGTHQDPSINHKNRIEDPDLTKKDREKITVGMYNRKLKEKQRLIQALRAENAALKDQLKLTQTQN